MKTTNTPRRRTVDPRDPARRRTPLVVALLLVLGVLAVAPAQASHGSGVLTVEGVATGSNHTCVLTSDGNVDCYGYNLDGQSADYLLGDAVGVAAGVAHTCVLTSGGNVDCYGYNGYGQSADYNGGDAVGIAAGGYHTCVLTSDGNVDCYGRNDVGQSADYTGGDAVGIAAGGYHTCVLTSGGNVDCYGSYAYGQSANYNGGDAVGIAAGTWHTCVLTSSGNVDCYGWNGSGQSADYLLRDTVGIAAGYAHTCVLTSTGNVDCYGLNDFGQSADYNGGDAVGVAAGRAHTCVLTSSGNVDCYGQKLLGQSEDWSGDSDGDSWHNDVETLCGSDPMDAGSQPPLGCVGIGGGSGGNTTSAQLLHEENVTVTPSQDVPPEDQEGTETPDYPGTDPQQTPDYPGTDPILTPDYPGTGPKQTPDYPGTDPVPTPEAGERVATVTVRNAGELVCVDVTPEGSGATEVICVNRSFLGPADAHVPRGDTQVLYLSEEETPDVPGTDPQEVPDVPGTDPREVPDVPGTDPVPVPDVPGTDPLEVPDLPPIPSGSLVTTPHVAVSLDASYRYDPDRLREGARVLNQSAWVPAGPGDEEWYLASGGDLGLTVTVSIYKDGEHQATVPVFVPFLGQALAAAEKTAGTL